MQRAIKRALTEAAFIIFLFYTNLLMGQYVHNGLGDRLGLWWALKNIFTWNNFIIALIAALLGYLVIEYLRERY